MVSKPLQDTGTDGDQWAPLAEVSGLPISELATSGADPALALSMRRLVNSLDDPDGVISAFSSFVS
ncbi:hypothetical protein DFJ67_4794 [Asanoa ferruginea]|uniref:FXSXX-COOH protein n=1 Tax=Asanoa ferruginea TaxID=53367 RepID=A0A3D9ZNE1_9ACTN|nr:hypothetical protein DFJ67_4794 [Asanoa ferruginea]GIF49516.1 hypothetical protein Afe04nite_40550 [Asanoa ferruginea]